VDVSEDLQVTEDQRTALIKYLIDNYFHSEEVDKVMREKENAQKLP
jgi:hypothetical protein